MSDTKANVHDKGRNSNSGAPTPHRNGGSHGFQHSNKQRTRATGGPPTSKLAVPRPVNLPSLRKEHEENEVQSHAASAAMVGSGWQRYDGQGAVEHASWSQHVAPKAVSWNKGMGEHEDRSTPGGHFVPVLDQEDFPSLEDATHARGHPAAPKARTPNKGTAAGLDDKPEEWSDGVRNSALSQPRGLNTSWEGDERFGGGSGELRMQYGTTPSMQHPGYAPIGSHGFPPSDPYLQTHYYHPHPPFYTPHPSGMRPNYRMPGYYDQTGNNMYAPYYRPLYPVPMHHGYHHDVYSDQTMFPVQPPPPPEMQIPLQQDNSMAVSLSVNSERDGLERERNAESRDKSVEQAKLEAEHPKTPDNVSGEGAVRTIKRQQSGEEALKDSTAQRPVVRNPSLPRDAPMHPLGVRGPSIDMDWDAQVDAEEQKANLQKALRVAVSAAKEATAAKASTQKTEPVTSEDPSRARGQRGGRYNHPHREQHFASSNSPLRREGMHSRSDNGDRGSVEASERGTPTTWRSTQQPRMRGHDRGRGRGPRSRPFGRHGPPHMAPYRPEPNLQDHWDSRPDFPPRGRFSRGRERGWNRWHDRSDRPFRNSRDFSAERTNQERTPSTVQGRKHFPGRGFRPKGVTGRTEAETGALSAVQDEPKAIQFGQLPIPIGNSFDLIAQSAPIFQSQESQNTSSDAQEEQQRDITQGPQASSITGLGCEEGHRETGELPQSVGPAQMDLTSSTPYVGTVLPEAVTDNGTAVAPHRSPIDDEGSGARSHPSDDRRSTYRGRDFHNGGGFHYRERGRGRWRGGGGRYGGRSGGGRSYPSTPSSAANGSAQQAPDMTGEGGPSQRPAFRRDFHSDRGGRTDWHRRFHSGESEASMHGKRPIGRGRGGRRGRGRDGGHHHRNNSQRFQEHGPRPSSSQAKVQWVPKKSSAGDGADQQTE